MADPNDFPGLWAEAVAKYEKQTERKLEKDSTFTRFQTIEEFENAVGKQKELFSSFRNENKKLASLLAKCVRPLQPILEIIQKGMGNTPYAPVCSVLGAAVYLLQACASVSKAYDGLEELFEQVRNITARLNEYEYRNLEASLKLKMTDILAFILEIMGKAEAVVKRGRIKQWARSVLLQEDEIGSAVTKLDKYVSTELGLVIALTYGGVKGLQNTTTDVQTDVKVVKAGVDEVLTSQRNDRQKALSEADEKKLSNSLKTETTDEIAKVHVANVEKLTKGTGAWISDDVMFKAWWQEEAPILWVFGKPGVGKTMLAARTIETLQNQYPQHSDIPSLTSVSYIYWKDDNPRLQECAQMWKAAALQIAKANDRFKKHVVATIDKKQDVFASARRIWQQLFLDFFTEDVPSRSMTSLAFIIVDGLDEAPEAERVRFLSCLAELVGQTTPDRKCRIQVAVFARPSVRADPGFEKVGFRRQERIIEVTPERNSIDIEAFIRQRLGDVVVLKMLKKRKATKEYQHLTRQIYSSVSSRSAGMFLWASLVFDQIWDSPSPESIRGALRDAPEGLDDMLHHVFRRLDVEEAMRISYLTELLSWIFCTYRPLFVSELFVLLVITANQHCYLLEDDLKARYASIFTVVGPPDDEDSDEEVEEEAAGGSAVEDDAEEEDDLDFLNDEASTDNEDENGDEGDADDEDAEEVATTARDSPENQEADHEIFNMPSRWHSTTVTFSHARIRDYLTTEGNSSTRRWNDCPVVPDNMNLRHLNIMLACIQLRRTDIADKYSLHSLKYYAGVNWMKHLVEVDFTQIDRPLAILIARNLSAFFHHGEGLQRSSFGLRKEFMQTWFATSKYSSLVRKIICDNIDDIDECERDWAASVKTSARSLFQPLIAACARTWLTKSGWDDVAYLDKSEGEVWIMYAFSTLDDDGVNHGPVDTFDVRYGMGNIPLESIEAIANLEPIPKSEHWYAGVAWILMEADEPEYTERSIEYFNKALELGPGGWMALEGLARCYGENKQEYETAIHCMEDAIHNLPHTEDLEGIDFYLQTRISDWKLHLGNDQESVEIAEVAYQSSRNFYYGTGTASDSSILRSAKHYIEALYRTEHFVDLTKLFYELDDRATWEGKRSLWTVFLRAQYDSYYNVTLFDKIGTITRKIQDGAFESFIHESIKKSVELNSDTVSDSRTIWLATQAAEWQYNYAEQPEQSIELWENVVTLVDQSNEVVQQSQAGYRTEASVFLSMMYFKAAKAASEQDGDPSPHVSKLENLAKHKQGSKRYYRASYAALLLGLWLREYANVDEESWMACIKPSAKQGLYLLSDDDPWNDQQAYANLGKALLLAGDILNASIALGITMRPLADFQKAEEPSQKAAEADDQFSDGELLPTAAEMRDEQNKERPSEPVEASTPADNVPLETGQVKEEGKDKTDDSTQPSQPANVGSSLQQISIEELEPEELGSRAKDDRGKPEQQKAPQKAEDEQLEPGAQTSGEGDDRKYEPEDQQAPEETEEEDDATTNEESTPSGSVADADAEPPINPKYAGFGYMWSCDGPCQKVATAYRELHFCRICNDVCFCEECVDLIKTDMLPDRKCAVDHAWVKVFPMVEEATRITDAILEMRFEAQQEWLGGLRRVWEAE